MGAPFSGLPIYYFSVRLYPKIARNPNSIRTPANGTVVNSNGLTNGHLNRALVIDEQGTRAEHTKDLSPPLLRKKQAPPPPSSPELNQALKALDDVLSSDAVNARPGSGDSGFNGDVSEESVVAMVHRADSSPRKVSVEDMFLFEKLAEDDASVEREAVVGSEHLVVQSPSSEDNGSNKSVVPIDENRNEAETAVENPIPLPPPLIIEEINKSNTIERKQKSRAPSPPLPSPKSEEPPSSVPPPPPLPTNDTIPIQKSSYEEPVPSPPPMPLVNLRKAVVLPSIAPDVRDEIKEFEKVTLKPVESAAPVQEVEEPPPDNHLQFGSRQHQNFRRKLEGVLSMNEPPQRPSFRRAITVHVDSFKRNQGEQKRQVEKDTDDVVKEEGGVGDVAVAAKAEPDGESSFAAVKSKFERTLNINPMKVEHSLRMATTLQSIRLRRAKSMHAE